MPLCGNTCYILSLCYLFRHHLFRRYLSPQPLSLYPCVPLIAALSIRPSARSWHYLSIHPSLRSRHYPSIPRHDHSSLLARGFFLQSRSVFLVLGPFWTELWSFFGLKSVPFRMTLAIIDPQPSIQGHCSTVIGPQSLVQGRPSTVPCQIFTSPVVLCSITLYLSLRKDLFPVQLRPRTITSDNHRILSEVLETSRVPPSNHQNLKVKTHHFGKLTLFVKSCDPRLYDLQLQQATDYQ